MAEKSECYKRSDATDNEYAREIFNKINSHFDNDITQNKIDAIIKTFIEEQLLDNNQFKDNLNNAILNSIQNITITENDNLLKTILKNSTIFQSYVYEFINDPKLKEQDYLKNLKNGTEDKKKFLDTAYSSFVDFLNEKFKNIGESQVNTVVHSENIEESKQLAANNVESGTGLKAFNCIYQGCDDKKIRDLFIHLAKAATTVKYKGRLATKVIDTAKTSIKKNKDKIEDILKNALSSLNFANDEKTLNSILSLMINDTNETTQNINKQIIMDLLEELIPKLKEKPILQNNSECVSSESYNILDKENSKLEDENSKLKDENSKLNNKFNEIQKGVVVTATTGVPVANAVPVSTTVPVANAVPVATTGVTDKGGKKTKSIRHFKKQFTKKRHRMIRKKTNRKTKKYGK